jgi:serine/threonine protein kinase
VFLVRGDAGAGVCKRLGTRALGDAGARALLEREGRIVQALAGRGAPRVIAAGADAAGPFVVTERLDMLPLGELASVTDAVVAAAFRALAEVHDASDGDGPLGIVHGDVSPSNLLVSSDGAAARLVDFGLSRMRDDAPPADGMFRGRLAFAAPEIARGEAFDARADLFALAASLLSVAAGAQPRASTSEAALLGEAGSEPIDAWGRPIAARFILGSALLACIAFDAADRPARAREVCGT